MNLVVINYSFKSDLIGFSADVKSVPSYVLYCSAKVSPSNITITWYSWFSKGVNLRTFKFVMWDIAFYKSPLSSWICSVGN